MTKSFECDEEPTRYKNGSIEPHRMVILQAPYIKRDPETEEISWPPEEIELDLKHLGLI